MTGVSGPEYDGEVRWDFKYIEMKFDGDLFEDHVVPLEMYAESMLAFGKAMRRTDLHASGKKRDMRVSIKAHGQGSFRTELLVEVPTLIDHAVALLTGNEVQAALNAKGLLALSIVGFVTLKTLGGRAFESFQSSVNGYKIVRTFDGDEFQVPDAVAECLEDPKWRAAVDEMTEPLEDDGVEALTWSLDGVEQVEITSADRPAFTYVSDDDDVEVTVDEMTIQARNVALTPGANWKFSAPGMKFSAQMRDEEFEDGVISKQIHVGPEDTLRVSLETTRFPDTRRPRRAVLKVHEHIEAPEQGALFD